MLKKIVIGLALLTLIGCKSDGPTFLGHLEAVTDKAVTLRNPNNGHMRTFGINGDTSIEVDGTKVPKLPDPVKNDVWNCTVVVASGTNTATKIEFKTK